EGVAANERIGLVHRHIQEVAAAPSGAHADDLAGLDGESRRVLVAVVDVRSPVQRPPEDSRLIPEAQGQKIGLSHDLDADVAIAVLQLVEDRVLVHRLQAAYPQSTLDRQDPGGAGLLEQPEGLVGLAYEELE